MVINFYNINSSFTLEEWYSYFCIGKNRNSEQKRLLSDCFQHFTLNYPFLDKTQLWGKVYQFLGIPHICGKIDRIKLKQFLAEKKRENRRLNKLNVQIKPTKVAKDNQIIKEDSKVLHTERQNAHQVKQILLKKAIMGNSNINSTNSQLTFNRQTISDKQIKKEIGSILHSIYKSEVQLKKRVRFNNVQILCFDRSNSSESEINTSPLLINEISKKNYENEKVIHTPYFERLNDSITNESSSDDKENRMDFKQIDNTELKVESELNLIEDKLVTETNKELSTRETQSNEDDINKLLEILGDKNDNRNLSLTNQFDTDSSRVEKRILPFSTDYEEEDSQSSDLMNDTGVMSPCYPSDDEFNQDLVPTTIKEQGEERSEIEVEESNCNLNYKQMEQIQSTISQLRNSSFEEISRELNKYAEEKSNEKIYSTSSEYSFNFDYKFRDKINIAQKSEQNESTDSLSVNIQNQLTNNNNYFNIFKLNETEDQRPSESSITSNFLEEDENLCKSPVLSQIEQECKAISPLSFDSEQFISLTTSDKLSPVGNIEKFRLKNSVSFNLESLDMQQNFYFSKGAIIDKSSELIKNEKREMFSLDNNKNNLSSQSSEDILSSFEEVEQSDSEKENRMENSKRDFDCKQDHIIFSNSHVTAKTAGSEIAVPTSSAVNSVNKREPLKLISIVFPKAKNSKDGNIPKNKVGADKENEVADISVQISPEESLKKSISEDTTGRDSILSDSNSRELDKLANLVIPLNQNEDNLSDVSKTKTDNSRIANDGKISDSVDSEEASSTDSDILINFNKLKQSTDEETTMSERMSEPNSPRQTIEKYFTPEVTALSSSAEMLSASPEDVININKRSKPCEDLLQKPKTMQEFNKQMSPEKTSKNVDMNDILPKRKILSFKTQPTTINSSDSFSGKEYLLKNFNECLSKVREQAVPKRRTSSLGLSSTDTNLETSKSRELAINSILSDSSQSSTDVTHLDIKKEDHAVDELTTQPVKVDLTDLGVKAYFNDAMVIPLSSTSSSDSDINRILVSNNYSASAASQEVNILNLKADHLDTSIKSISSHEDVDEQKIEINEGRNLLNDSSRSALGGNLKDEEKSQENPLGKLSAQFSKIDFTDLGVKAYFNESMVISLESSSDNVIDGAPTSNNYRSSTANQQINTLDLISPDVSIVNHEESSIHGAEQLSINKTAVEEDEDVEMKDIDIKKQESMREMKTSTVPENQVDVDETFNRGKRKVSSKVACSNNDRDADDSSSDSCNELLYKKVKRRRKKASRIQAKLKNFEARHNNKEHLTSSDEIEIINEIMEQKKKEKPKTIAKKTTTTNIMLINVINSPGDEETAENDQQVSTIDYDQQQVSTIDYDQQQVSTIDYDQQQVSTIDYDQQQVSTIDYDQSHTRMNNDCEVQNAASYDSIGGQRLSQEKVNSRKTSIVKQRINSSDTSTTSEFISSSLARRIFYL